MQTPIWGCLYVPLTFSLEHRVFRLYLVVGSWCCMTPRLSFWSGLFAPRDACRVWLEYVRRYRGAAAWGVLENGLEAVSTLEVLQRKKGEHGRGA